jgi:hypothetical protein
MSFEYRSPQLRDHDLRRILMTSIGLVLLLLVVATLSSTTSMVSKASGQGAQEETAEQKILSLSDNFYLLLKQEM